MDNKNMQNQEYMTKENYKKLKATIKALMNEYPNSYIDSTFDIILNRRTDMYVPINSVFNLFDLKCVILEYLSEDASYKKISKFNERFAFWDKKDTEYHNNNLKHINEVLKTNFSKDDMKLIFSNLNYKCNHELTEVFVNLNYDMSLLTKPMLSKEEYKRIYARNED